VALGNRVERDNACQAPRLNGLAQEQIGRSPVSLGAACPAAIAGGIAALAGSAINICARVAGLFRRCTLRDAVVGGARRNRQLKVVDAASREAHSGWCGNGDIPCGEIPSGGRFLRRRAEVGPATEVSPMRGGEQNMFVFIGTRCSCSLAVLALASAVWPGIGGSAASAAERQIEVEMQAIRDPVIITSVTVGDAAVECGVPIGPGRFQPVTPFEADEGWLPKVTIHLLNRTNEAIAYVHIGLQFPQPGDTYLRSTVGVVPVVLGRIPAASAFSDSGKPLQQDPKAQPLEFASRQTLSVHVGDYMEGVAAILAHFHFATVDRLRIYRSAVFFEDGMRWTPATRYSVVDPEHPGTFKRMGDDFFPGDPLRNWPRGR